MILEPKKRKSITASTFSPPICYEVMGLDAMILVFWKVSFKSTFWFSSFTLIKRLFSSPSVFAISMASSAYLRLLMYLLAILIPACYSSSLAFQMMYSACLVVLQSCPTLCGPMDCSLPGSSVHVILQARILEWVTIPFSRGSSQPKNQKWVSHIAGRFFTLWATREALIAV